MIIEHELHDPGTRVLLIFFFKYNTTCFIGFKNINITFLSAIYSPWCSVDMSTAHFRSINTLITLNKGKKLDSFD